MIRLASAACLLLLVPFLAAAEPVIVLVRHAERADMAPGGGTTATDPDLSPAGRARAESLRKLLKDARVSAIYVTEYRRTAQTAAPLAAALGVEPSVIQSKDVPALLEKLRAATGTVLVVGHSNSVPQVLRELGVAEQVSIAEDEFDNLFVVFAGRNPALLRLRY